MNDKDYVTGASRTEAAVTIEVLQRFANPQTMGMLLASMRQCELAAQGLDRIKKHLFYGKDLVLDTDLVPLRPCVDWFGENQIRLTHAALGLMTEAGEVLEAIHEAIWDARDPDYVNIREEFGDIFWYLAIGADVTETSFAQIKERNNAKLRARFPEKFTEEQALLRDLPAERKVLETATDAAGRREDRTVVYHIGATSPFVEIAVKSKDESKRWHSETAGGAIAVLHKFDGEHGFIYGYVAGKLHTWSLRDGTHLGGGLATEVIAMSPTPKLNLLAETILERK